MDVHNHTRSLTFELGGSFKQFHSFKNIYSKFVSIFINGLTGAAFTAFVLEFCNPNLFFESGLLKMIFYTNLATAFKGTQQGLSKVVQNIFE